MNLQELGDLAAAERATRAPSRRITDETFSVALDRLLDGQRVCRAYWPDGVYLVLVPGSRITVTADRPLGKALPHRVGAELKYSAHIDIVGAGDVAPWAPTQFDLLADDWCWEA